MALILRRDQLAKMRRWKGLETDSKFADELAMNPGQVSRILRGRSNIGVRFIEGCLRIWGIDAFPDLFAIEPDGDDDNGNGEAA